MKLMLTEKRKFNYVVLALTALAIVFMAIGKFF